MHVVLCLYQKKKMEKNYSSCLTHPIFTFLIFFILGLTSFKSSGQTCTINSGVPLSDCVEDIFLDGFASPITNDLATISWTLISQPSGADISIDNPNSLISTLSGNIVSGDYTFEISGDCSDGSGTAVDQITHTIYTNPIIPDDDTYDFGCYTGGGIFYDYSTSYTLLPNETINWTYSGGATATITNANTLTPTFFPDPLLDYCRENESMESYFLVTITNSISGCSSKNYQQILYDFSERPVEVRQYPTNICGLCTELLGTCNGNDNGLWTFTGPGNAIFSHKNNAETNVCVNIPGTYTFTWTVDGVCLNGTDAITVTFNEFGSPIFPEAGEDVIVCEFPNTLVLNATPLEEDQTGTWAQVSGLPVTINNPSNPSTQVSGLTAGSNAYEFVWTVCSPTCCLSDEVGLYERSNTTFSPLELSCATSQYSQFQNFAQSDYVYRNGIDTFWIDITIAAMPSLSVASGITFSVYDQYLRTNGSPYNYGVVGYSPTLSLGDSYTFEFNASHLDHSLLESLFGANPKVSFSLGTNYNGALGPYPAPGYYEFVIRYSMGCEIKEETIKLTHGTLSSTQPNAGTDASLPCTINEVILSGSNNLQLNGFYFAEWSMLSGPGPDPFTTLGIERRQQAPYLTGLVDGTYVFQLSNLSNNLNYCDTYLVDQMKVVVSSTAPPPVTATLNQIEVCNNGIANVTGSLPPTILEGTWSQSIGPVVSIESPNNPTTNISGFVANTFYEFTWTVSNDCGSSNASISFTTSSNQAPSIANIENSDQCSLNYSPGSNYVLSATPPTNGTGVWGIIDNFNQPGATITDVNAASTSIGGIDSNLGGMLNITWTVTNSPCGEVSVDTINYNFTLTNNITDIDAGEDIFQCAVNSYPLTLTMDATETGQDIPQYWEQLSGPHGALISDPTMLSPDITFYTPGIYSFRIMSGYSLEYPCNHDTDNILITISDPAPPAHAGDDQSICGGNGVFNLDALDLGVGESGKWTVSSTSGPTVTFGDITDPNTTATLSGTGDVRLRWQTFNNITECSPNQDEMVISYIAPPIVESDFTLCNTANIVISGENFTLVSSLSTTWSHSGPGSPIIETPSNNSSVVSGLIPGVHTFTYEVTNGSCTQSNDLTVTINEFIQANSPNQTFCGGETINLVGNTPTAGTVEWALYAGTNSGTFTGENTSSATYGPLTADESYLFSYTITNGSCISTDFVEVHILSDRILSYTDVESSCGNSSGSIDLHVQGGETPTLTYLWNNGSTTEDISGLSSGLYSVTVTHPSGCTTSTVAAVSSSDGPIISNFESINVCSESYTILSPTVSGGSGAPYTYLWSTGETTSSIEVSPISSQVYGFEVTDNSGCKSAKTITTTIRLNGTVSLDPFNLNCGNSGVTLTPNISLEKWNAFYQYGFEDPLGQWVNNSGNDYFWNRVVTTYGPPYYDYGPSEVIEGERYFRLIPNLPYGYGSGTATSPAIDLSAAIKPYFIFNYSMNEGAVASNVIGELEFEVSTDGTNWTSLWIKSGDQGEDWIETAIDISAYAGSTTFYGRFTYTDANALSIVGIDHIRVAEPVYSYLWSNGSTDRNINVNPLTNSDYSITVTNEFGCTETSSTKVVTDCIIDIGDYVWEDSNLNGIQDGSENGINGITVNLYEDSNKDGTPDGSAIMTTTTVTNGGSDGFYEFSGLDISTGVIDWLVEVIVPSGGQYKYVLPFQSIDNTLDSDLDPNTNYITVHTAVDDFSFDAGLYKTSSISDRVWLDENEDGMQNAGEVGVAGISVTLYDDSNTPLATVLTDAYGNYKFSELYPGDYYVSFSLPSNYEFTHLGAGGNDIDSDPNPITHQTSAISLLGGVDYLDADAGLIFKKSAKTAVGNFVWLDTNQDGIQDASEMGVSSIPVGLYDNLGNLVSTTMTNNSGFYIFDDLDPGTYSIGFNLPLGYEFTTQKQGGVNKDSDALAPATAADINGRTAAFTLAAGDYNEDIDAGIIPASNTYGSLGDFVFYDDDRDGLQDATEFGVPGVKVELLASDGITVLATTETDGLGKYNFTKLTAGNYYVRFVPSSLPTNYVFSTQNVGTDFNIDSNPNTTTGMTGIVEVIAGRHLPTLDAGVYNSTTTAATTASVGDWVWYDNDKDNNRDTNEYGVPGVTVELFDGTGVFVARTVTNPEGLYKFTDLTPGNYSITFSNIPTGYTFGIISIHNKADINGKTDNFTLSAGENKLDIDAGIRPGSDPFGTATLGNRVFYDVDNDGRQDIYERGVPMIKVFLLDGLGNPVDGDLVTAGIQPKTTTTNFLGEYLFTGLPSGEYIVHFDMTSLPPGYNLSPKDNYFYDTDDSDADPITGMSDIYFLRKGEDNVTVDAGIYNPNPLSSIGDQVFFDTDENGQKSNTELGVQGVSVSLYDSKNDLVATTMTDINGNYIFMDLVAANYYVKFHNLPVGTSFTSYSTAYYGSDADPETGITPTISLPASSNWTTIDAGLITTRASLGDYVWFDLDHDGFQGGSEDKLAGVTVYLFDGTGARVASAITDANGFYNFSNLLPDDYTIKIGTTPYGSKITWNGNTNNAGNSDIDPITEESVTVTLAAKDFYKDLDAGLYMPALGSISNFVWADTDADGLQTNGELGVAGVTVSLYDNATGNLIGTSITDGNGYYLFDNLPEGDYYLTFGTLPSGSTFTAKDAGSDLLDSDVNTGSGQTDVVTIGEGEFDLTVDVGLIDVVLPIELVFFDGVIKDCEVQLNWSTESETENDYFIIERKVDGERWTAIGRVDGNGTTNEIHNYYFEDNTITEAWIYYRLKQVDFDGTTSISEVVSLNNPCSEEGLNNVRIYPNPVSNQSLNLILNFTTIKGLTTIVIYDNLGRLVHQQEEDIQNDLNHFKISTDHLAAGQYYIKIETGAETWRQKFIKLN